MRILSDAWLMALALAAAALVLVAPVIGRSGHPAVADLVMIAAAGCGVLSFILAGIATVRAARRRGDELRSKGGES